MTAVRKLVLLFLVSVATYAFGCASGYLVYYGSMVARRMNSDNRFVQLALALDNYYNDHGDFPPLVWRSKTDGPPHSWRVALLPYLDEKSFLDEYDPSRQWNSPNNLALSRTFKEGTPPIFISPLAEDFTDGTTNYVGVVGMTTQWPSATCYFARRSYMVARNNNFFIIVEVSDSGIHWMEPRDAVAGRDAK